MKINSAVLIGFFFFFLSHVFGQNSYFEKMYKEEARNFIVVLKNEDRSSAAYKTALGRAITNYFAYPYFAPDEAPILFNIIFEHSHQFKVEYYRFLLLNAEYFSAQEMEKIKDDLPKILDKTDYQFYDIISLYRLEDYKPLLINEIHPDFYHKLIDAFNRKAVPVGLLEDSRPFTTLANLGDTSIADSLITLVNKFYGQCQSSRDTFEKSLCYKELYFGIVPKILGRLNSKRSVEQTIHLMMDDYELNLSHCEEYHSRHVFKRYIYDVILPKVSRYDQGRLYYEMSEVDSGQLGPNAFLDSINIRIKNNKIPWKKTLIDVK